MEAVNWTHLPVRGINPIFLGMCTRYMIEKNKFDTLARHEVQFSLARLPTIYMKEKKFDTLARKEIPFLRHNYTTRYLEKNK